MSDKPDAPCGPCGICQPNASGHQLIPGFDLYTKHRANTYIRQAVKESVRIKKVQAAKGHAVKVLPFFTWHLASDVSPMIPWIPRHHCRSRRRLASIQS